MALGRLAGPVSPCDSGRRPSSRLDECQGTTKTCSYLPNSSLRPPIILCSEPLPRLVLFSSLPRSERPLTCGPPWPGLARESTPTWPCTQRSISLLAASIAISAPLLVVVLLSPCRAATPGKPVALDDDVSNLVRPSGAPKSHNRRSESGNGHAPCPGEPGRAWQRRLSPLRSVITAILLDSSTLANLHISQTPQR